MTRLSLFVIFMLAIACCGCVRHAIATKGQPSAALSNAQGYVTDHGVVLTGKAGQELLRQCSRSTLDEAVTGYWNPGSADTQQLESDAPPFLEQHRTELPPLVFSNGYVYQ